MTLAEAAATLCVSRPTLWRLRNRVFTILPRQHANGSTGKHGGGRTYLLADEVLAYAEGGERAVERLKHR